MIMISVNNSRQSINNNSSVATLLEQLGYQSNKVAVAVNSDFVPRSQYNEYKLNDNDAVDILSAVQGG